MSVEAKNRIREIARSLNINEENIENESLIFSLIKEKLEMWGDESENEVNFAQGEKNGREFIENNGEKEALITEISELLKSIKFPNTK